MKVSVSFNVSSEENEVRTSSRKKVRGTNKEKKVRSLWKRVKDSNPVLTRIWETYNGMVELVTNPLYRNGWFVLESASLARAGKPHTFKYTTPEGLIRMILKHRDLGYMDYHMTVTFKPFTEHPREDLVLRALQVKELKKSVKHGIYIDPNGRWVFGGDKPTVGCKILRVKKGQLVQVELTAENIHKYVKG